MLASSSIVVVIAIVGRVEEEKEKFFSFSSFVFQIECSVFSDGVLKRGNFLVVGTGCFMGPTARSAVALIPTRTKRLTYT